jgi:hypothetical protein
MVTGKTTVYDGSEENVGEVLDDFKVLSQLLHGGSEETMTNFRVAGLMAKNPTGISRI